MSANRNSLVDLLDQLSDRRRSFRMSAESVDDRLGLETHGTTNRWEKQRREMSAQDLLDFANAVGFDVVLVAFEDER